MSFVYLGLGTNLGEKDRNLTNAMEMLSSEVGVILSQSSFYNSKPWGFESDNDFLNMVVLVETDLLPLELLVKTQAIERNLGRTTKSGEGYADRLIDIDILLYDNLIVDQTILKIPHPLIAERDFVLVPLVEIAPGLIHPVSGIKFIDILDSRMK